MSSRRVIMLIAGGWGTQVLRAALTPAASARMSARTASTRPGLALPAGSRLRARRSTMAEPTTASAAASAACAACAEVLMPEPYAIDDYRAVDRSGDRVAREGLGAVTVDRVVVAHHHIGRVRVALAQAAHQAQRAAQARAAFQGALPGRLDRRAIRHRVGERHADLDEIGPGLGEPLE